MIRVRYSIIILQKISLGGNSRALVVPKVKDRKQLHLVVLETLIQYTTNTFFDYQNLFLRYKLNAMNIAPCSFIIAPGISPHHDIRYWGINPDNYLGEDVGHPPRIIARTTYW